VLAESDTKRRAYDGSEHTLDDVVLECAKDQRGERLGIALEKEDIDRYLRAMSHGENISPEMLTAQAKAFGYDTLDEFYEDLKRLYRAHAAEETELHTLVNVTEQEAQNYAKKNPEYKDGVYYVQTALILLTDGENKDEIKRSIQDGSYAQNIDWSTPFDIAYKELAQDKSFISTMKIGDTHVVDTTSGLQVYKLKNSVKPQPIPFEERKKNIINVLREQKFKKSLKQYEVDVRGEVIVTRL
jgi:parvulin-like peptidyl-prolyl isomerase